MENKLPRLALIELVGSYGLIVFSAGLTCVNQMTAGHLTHQPGVFGIALGQGLILAAMLALTAPITGGYLNPALTLTLWVFNRVDTKRAAWLMGAQFLGGILAAVSVYYFFDATILQSASFGAPHINSQAYPVVENRTLLTGVAIELLLTFFLAFAIFGLALGGDALKLGIVAGMITTACTLFGYPLTGAAMNPARWLGPTLLEAIQSTSTTRGAWADTLVYLAGPIIGALLGGGFVFKVYAPPKPK